MVDEITLRIQAGKGGDGMVHFRREKYIPKGGPDGGDGGKGGDVIIRAVRDIGALSELRRVKKIQAENGQPGGTNKRTGKNGQDSIIDMPIGSLIWELKNGQKESLLVDLIEEGQEHRLARGGRGGWGNWRFATATRQTPRMAQPGRPGEHKELFIELQLLADVGLVGLPNSGKSTLLSRISNARPKIANYPFTTLEPNLGVVDHKGVSFVVADIPGIIEGAHHGKGLGDQFLRHIERTKFLVYIIDGLADDWKSQYTIAQQEIKQYDPNILKKPSIKVINKIDVAAKRSVPHGWFIISAVTGEGIEKLIDRMINQLTAD